LQAIVEATGRVLKDVKKDYKDKGDLGLVAMQVSRFFTSA
jgi:hypothetical protein